MGGRTVASISRQRLYLLPPESQDLINVHLREPPDLLWARLPEGERGPSEGNSSSEPTPRSTLRGLQEVYTRRCRPTARGIIQFSSHLNYRAFSCLRSWKRYRIGPAKTEKPGCSHAQMSSQEPSITYSRWNTAHCHPHFNHTLLLSALNNQYRLLY